MDVDVMLDSTYDQNRALDGDKVILRLLNTMKWPLLQTNPYAINVGGYHNNMAVERRVIDQDEEEKGSSVNNAEEEDDGDEDFEDVSDDSEEEKAAPKKEVAPKKEPIIEISKFQLKGTREERMKTVNEMSRSVRPLGSVISIKESPTREKELLVTLNSNQKPERAMVEKFRNQPWHLHLFSVPISKKLPWLQMDHVPDEYLDDVNSNKNPAHRYYMAKISEWKATSNRPQCRIVRSIGEGGNLEAESLRILKSLDIYSEEYDPGQKNLVNPLLDESLKVFTKDINPESGEWTIPEAEIAKRLDLRSKRIFTIDPATAKDLDDALSIEQISSTVYEIGVHIADVSYFVTQGTELDREA
mmetsp:Transcript_3225/g.3151  ORF Transcript_3225/g.3151 Transcript_3225/m.3151 type:complete len:358 (+) Transcript_3225:1213-2286(+)